MFLVHHLVFPTAHKILIEGHNGSDVPLGRPGRFKHPCPQSCLTLCHPMDCSMPCFTYCRSLLKLKSFKSMMPSNHLILCCPLLLRPSIFPSIRVFSNELVLCLRWPKYWSFSISLSNEYSGLIFFRIDWFDPFAVQGTLKSLLQHHS